MPIALKLTAAALGATIAAQFLTTPLAPWPTMTAPAMDGALALPVTAFSYRAAGDFSRDGKPAAAPFRQVRLPGGLLVMKNQVTASEYARCAADGACRPTLPSGSQDAPVVGVNWHDATAYAAWLSGKSGFTYRLPTDEEWSFAAAEKVSDEAQPLVDPSDPAQAWIARYDAEAARGRPDQAPQPSGSFGINSKGLADVGGNVWEWTNSCLLRVSLDNGGERITNTNCGVRVVQGAHRTYMTDFIRDPRTGGCAAGVPPANLGFRLVVAIDHPAVALFERVMNRFRRG